MGAARPQDRVSRSPAGWEAITALGLGPAGPHLERSSASPTPPLGERAAKQRAQQDTKVAGAGAELGGSPGDLGLRCLQKRKHRTEETEPAKGQEKTAPSCRNYSWIQTQDENGWALQEGPSGAGEPLLWGIFSTSLERVLGNVMPL